MSITITRKDAIEVDLDFLRKSMATGSKLDFIVAWNGEAYQVNALKDQKQGPLQLCTARGGVRGFKTIDAAAGVLADLGVEQFHVDLPYRSKAKR